ncbi:hypothetical protein [Thioalkalivibrio sp. ARh3]|uniref:hypothetical protein n=1 Tax=Thioalkalivibrio sp. ARh3 TaxID=1158148 RepID=UPI00035F2469|nr:hypothetical protein [Thioalkalivibrio sp. ARh3]
MGAPEKIGPTAGLDTAGAMDPNHIQDEDWPGHMSPSVVECPADDKSAPCYLRRAAAEMRDRAASRDTPEGERSMGRCVAGFNAIYGDMIRRRIAEGLDPISETMGWQFQATLKMSRAAGGAYREDDYTDQVAYSALAAECAAKEEPYES